MIVRAHASFRGTHVQDTYCLWSVRAHAASEAPMHEAHAIRYRHLWRIKASVSFRCTYAYETDHKTCYLLSIQNASHTGICLMCLYKLYRTTNPEVLLMYLGPNSAKVISQACLAALGVDGCKECATQTSWFGNKRKETFTCFSDRSRSLLCRSPEL